MPRYTWDDTEQAQQFVRSVHWVTGGRVRPTRRGRIVIVPHGARHGRSHDIDAMSRVIDGRGSRADLLMFCNCENPEPDNSDIALVSNDCPVHNSNVLYPFQE